LAFYRPSFLSPESIAISGSQNNDFSCQVNVSGETVVDYRLKILTMANVSVYDTGTATASPVAYDKERLYHTVPSGTLTNGTQYKWLITTNPTASTPTYSKETPFWSYSTPVVTFNATPTTISAKSYNFVCTYTQAENSAFKKWKMIWYDVSNTIIEDSGWSYSGYISYTFDGFLDGNSYKVKCFVETQLGTLVDTGYYQFAVDYAAPNLQIIPDATLKPEIGAVEVFWGRAVQITGAYTGATPTYVTDFMVTGNNALGLNSSSDTVYFDNLSIPSGSTIKFVWKQFLVIDDITKNFSTGSEELIFSKDMGAICPIAEIRFDYLADDYMFGGIAQVKFETSIDGISWVAFGTPKNLNSPSVPSSTTYSGTATTARYIRSYGRTFSSTGYIRIMRLTVDILSSPISPLTNGEYTLCSLDDGKYILSYDGIRFVLSGASFPSTLYSLPVVLNTNPYLIALLTTKAYIIQSGAVVAFIDI